MFSAKRGEARSSGRTVIIGGSEAVLRQESAFKNRTGETARTGNALSGAVRKRDW